MDSKEAMEEEQRLQIKWERGAVCRWVVATAVGAEDGAPTTYYKKRIVEAESQQEAEQLYNDIMGCDYYYGRCLGKIVGGWLVSPLDPEIPELSKDVT